jgi:hypothetical protein
MNVHTGEVLAILGRGILGRIMSALGFEEGAQLPLLCVRGAEFVGTDGNHLEHNPPQANSIGKTC